MYTVGETLSYRGYVLTSFTLMLGCNTSDDVWESIFFFRFEFKMFTLSVYFFFFFFTNFCHCLTHPTDQNSSLHLSFKHLRADLTPLHIAERAVKLECVVLGRAPQAPACKRKALQSKTGARYPHCFFFLFFSFLFITPFPSFFFSTHLLRCEDSCWFGQAV